MVYAERFGDVLVRKIGRLGKKTPLFAGSEAAGPEQRRGRIELGGRLPELGKPVNLTFANFTIIFRGAAHATNGSAQTVTVRPSVSGSTISSVPGSWLPR